MLVLKHYTELEPGDWFFPRRNSQTPMRFFSRYDMRIIAEYVPTIQRNGKPRMIVVVEEKEPMMELVPDDMLEDLGIKEK